MPPLTADSDASDADSAASGAPSNASDGDSSDCLPIPFDSDADAADSDADAASSNADILKCGLAGYRSAGSIINLRKCAACSFAGGCGTHCTGRPLTQPLTSMLHALIYNDVPQI